MCLEIRHDATESGATANQWQCNGSPTRSWRRQTAPDGDGWNLINANSGKCLAIPAPQRAAEHSPPSRTATAPLLRSGPGPKPACARFARCQRRHGAGYPVPKATVRLLHGDPASGHLASVSGPEVTARSAHKTSLRLSLEEPRVLLQAVGDLSAVWRQLSSSMNGSGTLSWGR
ncbi:RICIN domain-containing protein [Streptomyces cucumeris]|uniref:RICIN domain-containing protein n=1 Tax=Streptomyces cucumeris TaxID=2962890 RepID=UPI003D73D76F